MKQIQEIRIAGMSNGAHFTYIKHVVERIKQDEDKLIAKDSQSVVKVAELIANLNAAFATEDETLKLSQKSLLSDKISAADAKRDTLYAAYKKNVETYLSMPVEEMVEAATILSQHIKDYRIDIRAQIDKETGMLNNFIADLEGKYAAQVTALALTPFVTQLKIANQEVDDLVVQRSNERMGIQTGATKTARTATDNAYRALVAQVNALALVFGDTEFESFIDFMNVEVTRFKREVLGSKANTADTSADSNSNGNSSSDSGDTGSSDNTGDSGNSSNPGDSDNTGNSGNTSGGNGGNALL